MSDELGKRLDKILGRITGEGFLKGQGVSNDIPFYAFDYLPEQELVVREHINFLLAQIPKVKPDLRFVHINLFELVIEYLKERNFYDKAIQIQQDKGDDALLSALKAPLDASRLARVFAEKARPEKNDLVLVSGVGSAYPLLRIHNLLNNLHPLMGYTPLVLFYPGVYDGQSLRLFGILKDKPYYRAFRLVD